MIPLEVRQMATRYEKHHPDSSIHEAFIRGYQFAEAYNIPMADDAIVRTYGEDYSFDKIWDMYAKKRGRKKCEAKWSKLDNETKARIFAHVPLYVESTPDITYRKDFLTYLNGECWNDEIIMRNQNGKQSADSEERQFLEQSIR